MLLFAVFLLNYLMVGLIAATVVRWDFPLPTDGRDLLLDVVLWPIVVWYALRK